MGTSQDVPAESGRPTDPTAPACGDSPAEPGRSCSVGGCPLCGPWGLLVLVVLVALFVGGSLWDRVRAVKGSEPYRLALQQLRIDPKAKQALGEDIRDVTWFPGGRVFEEGDRGEAQFVLTVAGSRGEGQLFVQARRVGGRWALTELQLRLPDGSSLSLSPQATSPAAKGDGSSQLGEWQAGGEAPRWNPGGELASP